MDAEKFRPIFTREYLKLADGVTKGTVILEKILLVIESKSSLTVKNIYTVTLVVPRVTVVFITIFVLYI